MKMVTRIVELSQRELSGQFFFFGFYGTTRARGADAVDRWMCAVARTIANNNIRHYISTGRIVQTAINAHDME